MHLYLLPDYPISDQFFVITRVILCKLFQKISFWIFAMFTILPIFFDHVQMSLCVLYFIWKYSLFRLNKQNISWLMFKHETKSSNSLLSFCLYLHLHANAHNERYGACIISSTRRLNIEEGQSVSHSIYWTDVLSSGSSSFRFSAKLSYNLFISLVSDSILCYISADVFTMFCLFAIFWNVHFQF